MADPRITLLRRVPLFAHCSDKELAFIVTQVEDMDFAAGRALCHQGQREADFFVVVSGSAEVNRDGKVLRTMREGDFFGEIALIDLGPRTATVTAKTPMRCLVLGPGQFQNVLHQNAEIATKVLQAMAERLRASHGAPAD